MSVHSPIVVPRQVSAAPEHPAAGQGWLAIVVLACVAASFVRLWGIGSRPLWLDEAYSAWFSARSFAELWLVTPSYETHPPLYYSLLRIWTAIVGSDPAALRSLSAIAGVAAVCVLGICARELRPRLAMILAACALAALSPRLLVIAQDARPYALLFLSYSVAMLGWLRLSREFRQLQPGSLGSWALLGAGTLLTLWLHALGILYAAALLGALLITAAPSASKARWARLGATVASVILLYLPCVFILAGRAGDWSGGWLSWNGSDFPAQMLTLFGLHSYDEDITPVLALLLVPGLTGLGLWRLYRSGRGGLALGMALLVLLPPLAAALISQLGTPVFLQRVLVGVLAPTYLLCAFALGSLGGRRGAFWGGLVAAAFTVNLVQAMVRPPSEPWHEVAAILKRTMKPGDIVWVYPNDLALPLRSALGKAPIQSIPAAYPALGTLGPHPSGSPAVVAVDGQQARAWAARQRVGAGKTIWLVRGVSHLFDPDGEVARALAEGRRPGPTRRWRDFELQPLYPATGRPASPAASAAAR